MSHLAPNPCLLAILLVVTTPSGPQLAFHYPPNPDDFNYKAAPPVYASLVDEDSGDSDSSEDNDQQQQQQQKEQDQTQSYSTSTLNTPVFSSVSKDPTLASIDISTGSLTPRARPVEKNISGSARTSVRSRSTSTARASALQRHHHPHQHHHHPHHHHSHRRRSQNTTANNSLVDEEVTAYQYPYHYYYDDEGVEMGADNDDDDDDDDDVDDDDDDRRGGWNKSPPGEKDRNKKDPSDGGDGDDKDEHAMPAWDRVLGFDVSFLCSILAPPRTMCNTQFTLSIDDMVFVGLPIHVLADGQWRKTRKKKNKNKRHASVPTLDLNDPVKGEDEHNEAEGDSDIASNVSEHGDEYKDKNQSSRDMLVSGLLGPQETANDVVEKMGKLLKNNVTDKKEDERKNTPAGHDTHKDNKYSAKSGSNNDRLSMFHVVFVMNPPDLEFQLRLNEMFQYVVSRLAIVMRSEEAKSHYVSDQASIMLQIREEATVKRWSSDTLWSEWLAKSSLAVALSQIYSSISASSVANVLINTSVRSYQIPTPQSFSSLPAILEAFVSGITLTSAQDFGDGENDGDPLVVPHYALLLLDEPENIIRDIQSDQDSPFTTFIRLVQPTESLLKLSIRTGVDLQEIDEYARHLIYWRRARPILPIHQRNTYIVSPLAPIHEIYRHSALFRHQFPMFQSLISFLSLLSCGPPRQYLWMIPSRDHRDKYLSIMAWLLRFGYMTQLLTFAWIKVPAHVKAAVGTNQRILQQKAKVQLQQDEARGGGGEIATEIGKLNLTDVAKVVAGDKQARDGPVRAITGSLTLTESTQLGGGHHPHQHPHHLHHHHGGTSTPNSGSSKGTSSFEDTILPNLHNPTLVEKKWLEMILQDQPDNIMALFKKFAKYLDGRHPIEIAVLRENVSRHAVRQLFSALEESIVITRHW